MLAVRWQRRTTEPAVHDRRRTIFAGATSRIFSVNACHAHSCPLRSVQKQGRQDHKIAGRETGKARYNLRDGTTNKTLKRRRLEEMPIRRIDRRSCGKCAS
jgi:hypothetical protein